MPADTPTPGDSGAPLNLDDRVPCASCGGELMWIEFPTDVDSPQSCDGRCDCGAEWCYMPAPVTWRTLATSGEEVPAAYVARLVGEVDRLAAERTAHLLGVGHPMWLPSVADAVDHPDPFSATPSEVLDRVRAVVAERDELAATLANERGEGEPPVRGFHWSLGRRAWVYQPWLMLPKETGPERVVRQGPLGWELYLDGLRTDAEYTSARAGMADSPAVVAARGAK